MKVILKNSTLVFQQKQVITIPAGTNILTALREYYTPYDGYIRDDNGGIQTNEQTKAYKKDTIGVNVPSGTTISVYGKNVNNAERFKMLLLYQDNSIAYSINETMFGEKNKTGTYQFTTDRDTYIFGASEYITFDDESITADADLTFGE